MIAHITVGAVVIVTLTACGGGGSEPNTADDVDAAPGKSGGSRGARTLAEGTAVCLQEVAGQRYAVEDVLREHSLEPVESCIRADVLVKEEGQAGAFTLRYQMMGDAEWKECTSSEEDRLAFLDDCAARLVTELGSAGTSSASAESEPAE
jgi:hypothetical protein